MSQKLEIRKLRRLFSESLIIDDDILLFLILAAHPSHTIVKPLEEAPMLEIVSQVNYWPVLPVKPLNPIDILCKPIIHAKKEDDAVSNKSFDSGYESFFENDVYSISYSKDIVSCLLGIDSKSFVADSNGDFKPSRELVLNSKNVNVYVIFCEIGSKMNKFQENIKEIQDYGIISGLNQMYIRYRNEIFQIFKTEKLYVDLVKSVKGINSKLDYVFERILGNNSSTDIINNTWSCLRQLEVIQNYDEELYQSLMDLFTDSVRPVVDSILEGSLIEDYGLDFLSQQSMLKIMETDHATSILKEMDANHPLVVFKRTLFDKSSFKDLFQSKLKDDIYLINEERRNLAIDYHHLYSKSREERKIKERHERMLKIEKAIEFVKHVEEFNLKKQLLEQKYKENLQREIQDFLESREMFHREQMLVEQVKENSNQKNLDILANIEMESMIEKYKQKARHLQRLEMHMKWRTQRLNSKSTLQNLFEYDGWNEQQDWIATLPQCGRMFPEIEAEDDWISSLVPKTKHHLNDTLAIITRSDSEETLTVDKQAEADASSSDVYPGEQISNVDNMVIDMKLTMEDKTTETFEQGESSIPVTIKWAAKNSTKIFHETSSNIFQETLSFIEEEFSLKWLLNPEKDVHHLTIDNSKDLSADCKGSTKFFKQNLSYLIHLEANLISKCALQSMIRDNPSDLATQDLRWHLRTINGAFLSIDFPCHSNLSEILFWRGLNIGKLSKHILVSKVLNAIAAFDFLHSESLEFYDCGFRSEKSSEYKSLNFLRLKYNPNSPFDYFWQPSVKKTYEKCFSLLLLVSRLREAISQTFINNEKHGKDMLFFRMTAQFFINAWFQYIEMCVSKTIVPFMKNLDLLYHQLEASEDNLIYGNLKELRHEFCRAVNELENCLFFDSFKIMDALHEQSQLILNVFESEIYSSLVDEIKAYEVGRYHLALCLNESQPGWYFKKMLDCNFYALLTTAGGAAPLDC